MHRAAVLAGDFQVLSAEANDGPGETLEPSLLIVSPTKKNKHESQSKPGIQTVYPEPCEELKRRPQLVLAGTAPD